MDIFDIALAKQLAGGGGQPLYKHDVRIYEENCDYIDAYVTIYSSSPNTIDTAEKLILAIGNSKLSCFGSAYDKTFFVPNEISAFANMGCYDINGYYQNFESGEGSSQYCRVYIDNSKNPSDWSVTYTDTVTEIGTASVSGGGDCQIVDLGQLDGHEPAQSHIYGLLEPDSTPDGQYIYSYYVDCDRKNGTIAICSKINGNITATQITSDGLFRKFWKVDGEQSNQCFRPLGGKKLYRHNVLLKDDKNTTSVRLTYVVPNPTLPQTNDDLIRLLETNGITHNYALAVVADVNGIPQCGTLNTDESPDINLKANDQWYSLNIIVNYSFILEI